MKEMLGFGIALVVLSVTVIIGGAMVAKTENVTLAIAPGSTLISTLATDVGSALTTFTSLLPLLGLAVIGGLAIVYLMGFMGGKVE